MPARHEDLLLDRLSALPAPEVTDTDRQRARRTVASQSHDADDCRELLRMLGLMEPGFEWIAPHGHPDRRYKIGGQQ